MSQQNVDLSALLMALMSGDNQTRISAEAIYNSQLESNLLPTVENLLRIFSTSSVDVVIRSFGGVLLRKVIDKYSSQFGAQVTVQLRAGMLQIWSSESNPGITITITITIAILIIIFDN